MASSKIKIKRTEGGHKKGHSNVCHYEYTEIIKAEQKKRRRHQNKVVIKEHLDMEEVT